MSNNTQPLPDPDHDNSADKATHPFLSMLSNPLKFPRATQWSLAAVGGALSVAIASLAINWVVSTGEAPRSLPAPKNTKPIQMSRAELAQEQKENGETPVPDSIASDENSTETPVAEIQAQPETTVVLVEGARADGSGLKDFPGKTPEDDQRFQTRRDDDRLKREQRKLEDDKRRIERQLELAQLEERQRAEDQQLANERRDEDRRRIEDRLNEDRRLVEERQRGGQLASAEPSASPSYVP